MHREELAHLKQNTMNCSGTATTGILASKSIARTSYLDFRFCLPGFFAIIRTMLKITTIIKAGNNTEIPGDCDFGKAGSLAVIQSITSDSSIANKIVA